MLQQRLEGELRQELRRKKEEKRTAASSSNSQPPPPPNSGSPQFPTITPQGANRTQSSSSSDTARSSPPPPPQTSPSNSQTPYAANAHSSSAIPQVPPSIPQSVQDWFRQIPGFLDTQTLPSTPGSQRRSGATPRADSWQHKSSVKKAALQTLTVQEKQAWKVISGS
jgi:hypothetical protein